jgi:outer membrane protein TolC
MLRPPVVSHVGFWQQLVVSSLNTPTSVWALARMWLSVIGLVLSSCGVSWAITDRAEQSNAVLLPPLNLSLRAALRAALDNNPDVQLYRERIEAAQGQVRTQLGAMLPSLSSSIRQSRQTLFLGTLGLAPTRTDPFSIFDARVNGSQNVVSVSLIQRWRASRENLHIAEFESDARKYDTMASVGLAYMEGLRAIGMVKMRESNQHIMAELLSLVRQRQKSGVATGMDIARLDAQLANEKQLAASSRYDVQHAKLNLMNLLSLPFETPLTLQDEFKASVYEQPEAQTAVQEALGNRPEVQAQFTRVKAAELIYSSIAGERLPSLIAQGDYGLIGNRLANTLDTYNMALLLQIPIFDGAQREGRIAEARSNLRQEALRMRSVLNQIKMEVHDALAAMTAAKEQVAIAQAGLEMAIKELDLARERYAIITAATYFELTNGLNSVSRARENLVNALFQLNAARVNLARSTGTLQSLN